MPSLRTAMKAAAFVLALAGCAHQPPVSSKPIQPPASAASPDVASELTRLLAVAATGYPGVAFAIEGPGVSRSGGEGVADIETKAPMTATTPLSVYSVAKSMTATVALSLTEKGKLDLDRPVGGQADVPAVFASLTPRDLLTHTSGIRHYKNNEWLPNARTTCASPDQALKWFAGDPLGPRGTYLYSSFGYVLLSDVIQETSGEDFRKLMTERVFAPAGMTTASFWEPGMRRPPNGHEKAGASFRKAQPVDNSCKAGAGAIIASAEDLAKFGSSLAAGKLISPASWHAMTAGARNAYGLGWGVGMLADGTPVASHTGSAIGGTSAIVIDLASGLAVAVVGNAEGPSLLDDAKALLSAVRAAR